MRGLALHGKIPNLVEKQIFTTQQIESVTFLLTQRPSPKHTATASRPCAPTRAFRSGGCTPPQQQCGSTRLLCGTRVFAARSLVVCKLLLAWTRKRLLAGSAFCFPPPGSKLILPPAFWRLTTVVWRVPVRRYSVCRACCPRTNGV